MALGFLLEKDDLGVESFSALHNQAVERHHPLKNHAFDFPFALMNAALLFDNYHLVVYGQLHLMNAGLIFFLLAPYFVLIHFDRPVLNLNANFYLIRVTLFPCLLTLMATLFAIVLINLSNRALLIVYWLVPIHWCFLIALPWLDEPVVRIDYPDHLIDLKTKTHWVNFAVIHCQSQSVKWKHQNNFLLVLMVYLGLNIIDGYVTKNLRKV